VHIPDEELEWRFSGSGGPGGQHANTANTRVELIFNIARSPSLTEPVRQRLLVALGPQVRVVCSTSRSQRRNRIEARQRLEHRLVSALKRPPTRRPTRPGRGAVERRLGDKHRRAETKARRRWSSDD
jgi:ribosome-associated protein